MSTSIDKLKPGNLIIYQPDLSDDYFVFDLVIQYKNRHDQYTTISYLLKDCYNQDLSIEYVNIFHYHEAQNDQTSYVWILT